MALYCCANWHYSVNFSYVRLETSIDVAATAVAASGAKQTKRLAFWNVSDCEGSSARSAELGLSGIREPTHCLA